MIDSSCNPSVLLRQLLEEIDLTVARGDPIARYANAIRERQRTDPSGEIQIVDGSRASLLRSTPYTGSPPSTDPSLMHYASLKTCLSAD